MFKMNFDEAIEVARLCAELGQVKRATQHPDGEKESDTTHSMMLAMVALWFADDADLLEGRGSLNRRKLLTYALVHDLPEIYAGDTDTSNGLTAEQAVRKAVAEHAALQRIRERSPWIGKLIMEYAAQDTPEARIVRVLDKALPKLMRLEIASSADPTVGAEQEQIARQREALREEYPEEYMDPVFNFFDEVARQLLMAMF